VNPTGAVAERDAETAAAPAVGARVRALRDGIGLSLRDLADRSGVSAPMLSQVERGETSPTLAIAARIASGLDLSLSQLLRLDEGEHVAVVRRGQGRKRRREAIGSRSSPALPGQRADVPGTGSTRRHDRRRRRSSLHEPGSRETAAPGGKGGSGHRWRAPCARGDCVTFDADLVHHFQNDADEPAQLLAVVAAGLRRS
jgi:transcriptional regulator with XRE-family HTH domain